ncbi:20556_t:CDS:2, partial [Dentiscutata erythropus]
MKILAKLVITNISKSEPGKRKLIFSSRNNDVKKINLLHDSKSNSDQTSKNFIQHELDFELLDLHSDDSNYTCKQKKDKFRAINEVNIDNDIQTIIQKHQELNNNSKCIYETKKYLVGKNDLFKDHVLDIGKDSLVIKKTKIDIESSTVKLDKNNSLYS